MRLTWVFGDCFDGAMTIRKFPMNDRIIANSKARIIMPFRINTFAKSEKTINLTRRNVGMASIETGMVLVSINKMHFLVIDKVFNI